MKDKLIPWKKREALPDRWRTESDPFDMLHREINELFDGYYRGFGMRKAGSADFELSEGDDEIRVKIELPGMDENDISIELEEDVLSVRGERRQEKESRKRNYHVSEISYGTIHRTIPLPARVDQEKAKAKFRRGVLSLTLPKAEDDGTRRRQIPVSTG
ncbi:MAG: Hsp20/alpha crystallin family protein [Pontiellaceae bacterium]|nr:Hsp20/alpha crystallin family protein [Pontiellaceae bacterium]MBN2785780.1 Hsp20/alpha crystallin family protein [Pontiellaceae bacterium]